MTVNELVKWCEENGVSKDTKLCFDRGIDLIEDVANAVHTGVDIILYAEDIEDESIVV